MLNIPPPWSFQWREGSDWYNSSRRQSVSFPLLKSQITNKRFDLVRVGLLRVTDEAAANDLRHHVNLRIAPASRPVAVAEVEETRGHRVGDRPVCFQCERHDRLFGASCGRVRRAER